MKCTPEYFSHFSADGVRGQPLENKYVAYPAQYLEYARTDLKLGSDGRSRVNAFANAKRGLHCQIDILLVALGIQRLRDKKYEFFPGKLEFLQQCGIVSPAILRRINSIRNKLEHEYLVPSGEATDTCLDVVELFLAATAGLITFFPEQADFADTKDRGQIHATLSLTLEQGAGRLLAEWHCIDAKESVLKKQFKLECAHLRSGSGLSKLQKESVKYDGVESAAWHEVFRKHAIRGSKTVEIVDTEEFCSWVRILLSGAA